jgi:hypothetical protein
MNIVWMALGLINPNFGAKKWVRGQIWRLVIGLPVILLLNYFFLFKVVSGYEVLVPLTVLFFNGLLTLTVNLAQYQKGKTPLLWPIIVVLTPALAWAGMSVMPYLQAEKLASIPQVTVSAEAIPVTDVRHIREVPIENALFRAQKVIGELGIGYQVGTPVSQSINNHTYWVVPLEFRGFFKWRKFKTIPGVILVDAENSKEPARLLNGFDIQYAPSAFFGKDLARHLHQHFKGYYIDDLTLELDDNFKPYYVASVIKPTLGYGGEKVVGVAIVEPTSGEIAYHTLEEMPAWIDRAFPEKMAVNYNVWFGKYKNGLLNSIFSQQGVHLPTDHEVFGIIINNQFYWFTGHTSPSVKDDSLIGYTLMNARTGEITYYDDVEGYFNEQAAKRVVSEAVSNFEGYSGTQPLFYNIYNREVWIVPVISNSSQLQRFGIVDAKTGNTVVAKTKSEALLEFQQYLAQKTDVKIPSNQADYREIEAKVQRIANEVRDNTTYYYLLVEGKQQIFSVSRATNQYVPFIQSGDVVRIKYIDTTESIVPIMELNNVTLGR